MLLKLLAQELNFAEQIQFIQACMLRFQIKICLLKELANWLTQTYLSFEKGGAHISDEKKKLAALHCTLEHKQAEKVQDILKRRCGNLIFIPQHFKVRSCESLEKYLFSNE